MTSFGGKFGATMLGGYIGGNRGPLKWEVVWDLCNRLKLGSLKIGQDTNSICPILDTASNLKEAQTKYRAAHSRPICRLRAPWLQSEF